MDVFYSPRFLEHYQARGHPESPERLEMILGYLEKSDIDMEIVEPQDMDGEELGLVHSRELVEKVKRYSGEQVSLPDNCFHENTFEIAGLAASASLQAAENAIKKGFSFALVRPPGHHAGKDFFGGFCYFNNLAFAVRKTGKRTLAIDFDVHHGNGTQDIFYNDGSVYYLSLHQFPLFPGTGRTAENNEHVCNIPLPPGTNDDEYLEALDMGLEKAEGFQPELVAVSAGFDSWIECPIAGLSVSRSSTFYEIGKRISSLGCPAFACLEGGYAREDLGKNVYDFLRAFQ
ncbi:histone deacetylase family protein [Candidatus Micrarchaeota archaeon]|nr:histone deacetylase family protein [Candidatus Micrarchaeota archaeon]